MGIIGIPNSKTCDVGSFQREPLQTFSDYREGVGRQTREIPLSSKIEISSPIAPYKSTPVGKRYIYIYIYIIYSSPGIKGFNSRSRTPVGSATGPQPMCDVDVS